MRVPPCPREFTQLPLLFELSRPIRDHRQRRTHWLIDDGIDEEPLAIHRDRIIRRVQEGFARALEPRTMRAARRRRTTFPRSRRAPPSASCPPRCKTARCRSRRHSGCMPPATDISVCPLAAGNGRTYTSNVPDSSEAYASHRPFGAKRAWTSLNGVARNGVSSHPRRAARLRDRNRVAMTGCS